MAKSKKQKHYTGKIPFNVFGDQLHYPEGYPVELKVENFRKDGVYGQYYGDWKKIYFQDRVEKFDEPKATKWDYNNEGVLDIIGEVPGLVEVDNYIFEDTLTYSGYARGRSAAYFKFARSDGHEIIMFLVDLEKVIPFMVKGKVTGKFTFCKRGANFGLTIVN